MNKYQEALELVKNPVIQLNNNTNALSMHINCSYEKACERLETIKEALAIAERDVKGVGDE